MDRIPLAAVAALLLLRAAPTAAEPIRSVAATPWPGSVSQPFANPIEIPAHGPRAVVVPHDSIAYRNDFLRPFFFNPGAEAMFADDLHMLFGGRMTEVTLGIYKPPQTPLTSATISVYANDASDTEVGALLAGPYVISALLPDYHAYGFNTPDSSYVTQHVWLAVKFSTAFPGLVAGNDAVVGVSHDLYWDFENGGRSQLNQPPANFLIEVRVIPDLVAVQPVTWTRIKALYAEAVRHPAARGAP